MSKYKPQKHITSCLLRGFPALCSNKTLRLAVDMTMLYESSTIPKYKIHTSFNIAIFQILFSIMQVKSILHAK